MYGLVSTGNKFPYTILKIIFANQKNILSYFMHILNFAVDKAEHFSPDDFELRAFQTYCFVSAKNKSRYNPYPIGITEQRLFNTSRFFHALLCV
jgi:hypothetical protein